MRAPSLDSGPKGIPLSVFGIIGLSGLVTGIKPPSPAIRFGLRQSTSVHQVCGMLVDASPNSLSHVSFADQSLSSNPASVICSCNLAKVHYVNL